MKIYTWLEGASEKDDEKELLQRIDEGEGVFYVNLSELLFERLSDDGMIVVLECTDIGKISSNPKYVSIKSNTLKNAKRA